MIFMYVNVDSVYDEMCRPKTPKNIRQIGLLARPHSIRKTRLNIFIRSNAVRGAAILPETDR